MSILVMKLLLIKPSHKYLRACEKNISCSAMSKTYKMYQLYLVAEFL